MLRSLGFTSELFAMQSEVWFYNSINANNYSFREMIASEERNEGKSVDDMLLVDEVKGSLARYPKGKHLIMLHTKGSHYLFRCAIRAVLRVISLNVWGLTPPAHVSN